MPKMETLSACWLSSIFCTATPWSLCKISIALAHKATLATFEDSAIGSSKPRPLLASFYKRRQLRKLLRGSECALF